jgi:hypothetical protein
MKLLNLFGESNSEPDKLFREANEIYRTLPQAGPGSWEYRLRAHEVISRLRSAIELEKNHGDAHVLLANTYLLLDLSISAGDKHILPINFPLLYAVATIEAWSSSPMRRYPFTKNVKNGKIMHESILHELAKYYSQPSTKNKQFIVEKLYNEAISDNILSPSRSTYLQDELGLKIDDFEGFEKALYSWLYEQIQSEVFKENTFGRELARLDVFEAAQKPQLVETLIVKHHLVQSIVDTTTLSQAISVATIEYLCNRVSFAFVFGNLVTATALTTLKLNPLFDPNLPVFWLIHAIYYGRHLGKSKHDLFHDARHGTLPFGNIEGLDDGVVVQIIEHCMK